MPKEHSPAEQLEAFLKFVDQCTQEYRFAHASVGDEDKRLQDLVHEMEFAPDKAARNRVATKLQQSRRSRREKKDVVVRTEKIVKFFEEPGHRGTLNKLRNLLGQQRREEEYLQSKRTYKPRTEGK